MSTVTVACLLPHGIKLELGLVLDREMGMYRKSPNYTAVVLNGTHSTTPRVQGLAPVAVRNPAPGITHGVDEEFITHWLKQNAALGFVKAGFITIVKPADVAAASKDLKQMDNGFNPLDPSAMPKELEKATHDE
jgi:hypothetical protein